jgi:hypothetical protein
MAETKKTPIIIDGVEYIYEDLSGYEQTIINHISDLEKKINNSQFNLDQLNVGKNAFISLLKSSVDNKPLAEAEETKTEEPTEE